MEICIEYFSQCTYFYILIYFKVTIAFKYSECKLMVLCRFYASALNYRHKKE